MSIKKFCIFGLSALAFCSIGSVNAFKQANAIANAKEHWLNESQADYPRLDSAGGQYLFAYCQEAVNFNELSSFEASFTLSEASLYTSSSARKWFVSLSNVGNDTIEASDFLSNEYQNLLLTQREHKGVFFAFSAESNWGGCMMTSVYDGTGKNNTGAYLGNNSGWTGDFAADPNQGAKSSGSSEAFSMQLWNQNVTLKITRDADYYNFQFNDYTYSVLRTRVEKGNDFTNVPRFCLGCVNYGEQASNMGFNVSSIVRNKKTIVCPNELTMTVGDATAFAPTTTKEGDSIESIVSNNTNVVTYADGTLTAVGAGTAIVTVTSQLGETATCNVTVNAVKNKVSWPTSELTMFINQEKEIKANIEIVPGSVSSETTLDYTTNNSAVAKYEDGCIVGVGVGSTEIVATSKDGVSASIKVTILNYEVSETEYLDYVASDLASADIVKLKDGVSYMGHLGNTSTDMLTAGKFYINEPININKYISCDLQMQFGNRWVAANGNSGRYSRLNIALNDLGPAGSEDLSKLTIPVGAGVDGVQLKLYSDKGWEAWNNFQYNTYVNGTGLSTDLYSATPGNPNINAVVSDMRNDKKVNLKMVRTASGMTMTFTCYEDNGSLSSSKKWEIPFSGEVGFENKPYLGFIIENTTPDTTDLGVIISNFHNGSVKELIAKDGEERIDSVDLKLGENKQLTIESVLNKGITEFTDSYTYEIENTDIATVSSTGFVSSVFPGNTTLTVTNIEGEKLVLPLSVDVNSLTVSGERQITVNYGADPITLVATTDPEGVEILWSSDDETIATVDDGVVSFVGAGEVTIIATAGKHTVETEIKVNAIDISLNVKKLDLEIGDEFILRVEGGDDLNLVWTSSDDSVCTVDKNGKVTAIDVGSATITVSFGDKTDTCSVTVKKHEEPDPGPTPEPEPEKKGCGSSLIASSGIITIVSICGVILLKRKEK